MREVPVSARGVEIDLIGWAERFIATPSVSRQGNAQIAALAADLAAEAGLLAKLDGQSLDGVTQVTLRADLGPQDAGGGLLLLTHLDTVPPGELSEWTETGGDPFRPTRRGDRLYGLGSADAKVDLICKIAALASIDPARLRRPVRLVGTYAEEIGLLGARDFVERGGTEGMRYALVGEPSELVAIRAHKGYAVFDARIDLEPLAVEIGAEHREVARGTSAHSSTPQLGVNAIERALERLARGDVAGLYAIAGGETLNKVPDRCDVALALKPGASASSAAQAGVSAGEPTPGGASGLATARASSGPVLDPAPLIAFHRAWRELCRDLEKTRDADFDPSCTVGNLGRIRIDGRQAVIGFDLRPVPGVDVEQVVRVLEPHAQISLVRVNPPLATAPTSPLLDAIRRAQSAVGVAERVGTKATCTEAGVVARAGLDVVVLGAGISVGNVHKPNEHTVLSQLPQARDLYRNIVERLCTEGPSCS
jgi:acetylornithine deacetylase/succinyl-diaminopimelate desuccinylase-like protein